MVVGALLRSVASRLRRGGARSGPGGFLTPPPTSNQQSRGYGFVVGMAAGAALRSLATKLARAPPAPTHRLLPERLLNRLDSPKAFASGSSLPLSKLDLSTSLAKTRAGVAYVALFGSLAYMYGWIMPRFERLGSELKAQELNDNLTQAIKAVELLLEDVSADSSSGLGKKPDSVTGNSMNAQKVKSVDLKDNVIGNSTSIDNFKSMDLETQSSKDSEAPARDFEAEISKLNDLIDEIAKLKMSVQSRSKERKG